MKTVYKNALPTLSVLIAGIMWGIIGLFVRKLNNTGFSSMCIVFIRSIAGTLLMGAFLFVYNKSLFRIKFKDIFCFVGTGIISLTFFNICYFTTISMTSLSVAAILLYTAPAMVMILSFIFFKEKMNLRKVIAVLLSFFGCVLVTGVIGNAKTISGLGILIGLGSGLGYALYSIFARIALNKGYHSFTVTFYTLLFSVLGGSFFVQPRLLVETTRNDITIIPFMLLFGLVSTTLPYIFYTLGLERMESGRASVIASIEPVTATIMGICVFNEQMSFMQAVGVIIVLLSIAIVNLKQKKNA